MTISDWITIVGIAIGLFSTTIGSTLYLAFKIGAVHEKVTAMEKALEKITKEEIPWIKYTIAQMQVKLDVLWHFFLSKLPDEKRNDV